jgi:hypothetical protein
LRAHIQEHMVSLQKKQMAAAPGGQPGTPGGQQGRGMPGQPRQGAMPGRLPTGTQSPPGAIPADQMNPAARAARPQRGNSA